MSLPTGYIPPHNKQPSIPYRLYLLRKLSLQRKISCYMEIGVHRGDSWRAVDAPIKIGIDPNPMCDDPRIHVATSDFYFQSHDKERHEKVDLAFVDGYHSFEQAKRDFENVEGVLSSTGVIAIHDVWPPNAVYTSVNLCGDVWRIVPWLLRHREYFVELHTGNYGVLVVYTDKFRPDDRTVFPNLRKDKTVAYTSMSEVLAEDVSERLDDFRLYISWFLGGAELVPSSDFVFKEMYESLSRKE